MGTNSRGSDGDRPTAGATSRDIPDAVVTELRSDERCRTIVSVLSEIGGPIPLIDLAEEVLVRERDGDSGTVQREDVADVRTEIYDRDLPKLTAVGVVSFDSLVSTVELTDEGARLLDGDT